MRNLGGPQEPGRAEWSDSSSQEFLTRLGVRISPFAGLRMPPSYATIRRAAMAIDADEFDLIVNTWAAQQADRRSKTPVQLEPAGSDHKERIRRYGLRSG